MSISAHLGSILFAGLGLLLWSFAARALWFRVAMKGWPVEKGVVEDHRSRPSRRSTAVDVQVAFQHSGRALRVWCVSPTRAGFGRGSGEQGLRQKKARFPRGATVDIFVNPSRPEEAYLELPELHIVVALLAFGALLIAMSLAINPWVFGLVTEELAILGFMLVLGAVLTLIALSMGLALFRAYFPGPRKTR